MGFCYGIEGDTLSRVYRNNLSDYPTWDQKEHATDWILLPENMGLHLSIDETSFCGHVYTNLTRKDAKGRKKVIAIIKGVKSSDVSKKLKEIPENLRTAVTDVSMDFSDSMKLTARSAFPNATISLDRFHVMQDLNDHMMEAYTDIRKRLVVEEKHERAAYYRKVDRCNRNRKRYRKNHPKTYTGRKRGRKRKLRKSDFEASRMPNGETKRDFLRRCFYTVRQNPDKWTGEQRKRMQQLFASYPEMKEAFDLKEEFRLLYWSKKDNQELKGQELTPEEKSAIKNKVRDELHEWYRHVNAGKSSGIKRFMATVKEREEDLLNYYETFVTNAQAENFHSQIKGLRADCKGISSLPFFFFRVCKIFG